jgi:hypothetical protein
VSKNVDGYRLSSYLYKDKQSKGGKLFAGPAWDYNLAWWNANYCAGDDPTGWAYEFGTICPGDGFQLPFWWAKLMTDPPFQAELKCRWNELRPTVLSNSSLNNYIDSTAAYLDESQARHFQAWPILGVWTWPNPSPLPTTYAEEITALKLWVTNRMTWLDANMPGVCNVGVGENSLSDAQLNIYPNPFNSDLDIEITLARSEKLKMELFDILGNKVNTFSEQEYTDGYHDIKLDLSSKHLSAGVYFLKISSDSGSIVKKITKSSNY